MTNLAARRVAPFGHPGITAHVQLPQAYRSLSRPSSPLDAKASTVCLIAFDLKSHVVSGPAIGSGRRGVDSSHPSELESPDNTIHPSIVKEPVGPRTGRQEEVMRV